MDNKGPPDGLGHLPNPCDDASWLEYMFFMWPTPMIRLGASRIITLEDLPPVSVHDEAKEMGGRLKMHWTEEHELKGDDATLHMPLVKTFREKNWHTGIWLLIETGCRIYQALTLGRLIDYFLGINDGSDDLMTNGYFLSFLIVILGICITMLHHHAFFLAWRLGLQLRMSLTTLIYDKAVNLSLRSLSKVSLGHVVNLSSQDIEGFQLMGCFLHFTYQPIIESFLVLYFGVVEIGWSFLAGFALIMLLIPMQKMFSVRLSATRRVTSGFTDQRIKLVNQALTGARLMKINGWENIFTELIEATRKQEVGSLLISSTMRGLNEAIFFAAPVIIACITFTTYTALGNTLSTSKIFIVLSYYNMIQFSMTKFFALAVQAVSESSVALGRIAKFLKIDDKEDSSILRGEAAGTGAQGAMSGEEGGIVQSKGGTELRLTLTGVCASWLDEGESDGSTARGYSGVATEEQGIEMQAVADKDIYDGDVLREVDLDVREGEVVAVVGPVGCSKTSLLMAIMGELRIREGSVEIAGQSKQKQMTLRRGDIFADGKVPDGSSTFAYAAQEPWIMSNTLRNNILFGLPYDREWYDAVISACSLDQDLIELPNGDLTIIGDKGVNLSGGQKARVGLARALYTKAHIMLLDDPLSAVDSHVGNTLFNEAVCSKSLFEKVGRVANKRIVILVTHQTQFLSSPQVDRIVVMAEGRVTATGTYSELVEQGKFEFVGFGGTDEEAERAVSEESPSLGKTFQQASAHESVQSLEADSDLGSPAVSSDDLVKMLETAAAEGTENITKPVAKGDIVVAEAIEESAESQRKGTESTVGGPASLIKAEDKETGEVKTSTYRAYGESMGGLALCSVLMVCMIAPQVMAIMCNYWLALWSRKSADEQTRPQYINTYLILVVVTVATSLIRALFFFQRAIVASERMHNLMLRAVLRAKITFFDSNPIGRILNRFAKDTTLVDDMLPFTMYDFVQCALMVLGACVVVAAGAPYIFIALVPLILYFGALRRYFLNTSREVKRIEALSRSPVFSHLSETLDGLCTIRALNRKEIFLDMHKALVNDNCRAFFCFIAASRWLGFRLDAIVTVLLMVSTFGAVAMNESNLDVDPNLLAVGIMYVIQLTGLFQWCVRQSAEVESQMVSAERIQAFTMLPSEPRLHGPANVGPEDSPAEGMTIMEAAKVSSQGQDNARKEVEYCADVEIVPLQAQPLHEHRPNWPERGGVTAHHLTASYRHDLPPVLRDVSFTIQPGSRCGVVGRTGAGKSTLVGTFMRLVESTTGHMYIDGLDTSQIGLHDLRPRISIIPQTPFLFSGTVRKNLDPWNQHSDQQIWEALRATGLEGAVSGKRKVDKETKNGTEKEGDRGRLEKGEGGLESVVEESGMNFSTGERQLLCLARAILQRNKILIMDEATANIDLDTDNKVQAAIYNEFTRQGTTVITIAHRLQTVIENDQILVLARGKLAENGHPHDLLVKYFGEPSEEGQEPIDSDNIKAIKPPRHSFASLVKQTGAEMSLKLRRMAMLSKRAEGVTR